MRLSTKHANQQIVELNNFSGGLNTSTAEEQIQPNQLAKSVNFELQAATGLLKTVDGTRKIYRTPETADYNLIAGAYDLLNKHIVLFASNGTIFSVPLANITDVRQIGRLSNNDEPVTATWESGLIVASGGHLQYIAGYQLKTITTSPAECKGCYTRDGRVVVFDNDKVTLSAVGDEEGWEDISNDDSSSKFIRPGYKQGGKIVGLINMSSDMLIIKDNGMLRRLSGVYPNWEDKEVSRGTYCRGKQAYCNVLNNAYILGRDALYGINTTQEYGDMKAANVAQLVESQIKSLPLGAKMRFVPTIKQIWIVTSSPNVLMMDINTGAFYVRLFNAPVYDVVDADDKVYIIKGNGFDVLDEDSYTDENIPLQYSLQTKTLISHNEYLLKRVVLGCTGYSNGMHNIKLTVNDIVTANCPIQSIYGGLIPVYGNTEYVYRSNEYIINTHGQRVVYNNKRRYVFNNGEYVFDSGEYIIDFDSYSLFDQKLRFRNKALVTKLTGAGGKFVLNTIKYDVVEV